MMTQAKFEVIRRDLEQRGYAENGIAVVGQRTKKNNIWQRLFFSAVKGGVLSFAKETLYWFPWKKWQPDFENCKEIKREDIEKIFKVTDLNTLGINPAFELRYKNGERDLFQCMRTMGGEHVKFIIEFFAQY